MYKVKWSRCTRIAQVAASLLLICTLVIVLGVVVYASDDYINGNSGINNGAESDIVSGANIDISAKSAILINAETGAVLYAKNANEALAPASVTKIMTLLLVAEALEDGTVKLDDKTTISSYASSMGGSQVFLEQGEQFTVDELIKCTVIASANDAAVALAEHMAGSEALFVERMNARAKELGMRASSFENVTGLDDEVVRHLTSAYDIVLMSRELMKHECVMKYACVWQDSIRNGSFTLTNTNRLVRYYSGCTGLKTGSTDKAGYCVSATAKRGEMSLIAVIMGAETRDKRNEAARTLLDYGFATYDLYTEKAGALEDADVYHGSKDAVTLYSTGFSSLVEKKQLGRIEKSYVIPEYIAAPKKNGDVVGEIIYSIDGEEIGRSDIIIKEDIERVGLWELFLRLLESIFVNKSK